MKKDYRFFLFIILFGLTLLIISSVFRYIIIIPLREWQSLNDLRNDWAPSLLVFLSLKIFYWMGFAIIGMGLLSALIHKLNPNFLLSNKKSRIIFISLLALILWLNALYLVVYPPFWLSLTIILAYISLIIAFCAKSPISSSLKNLFSKLNYLSKFQNCLILLIPIVVSIMIFIPSPFQPCNYPNRAGEYYIQNNKIINIQTNQELRLMGWDYHWVHFSGLGEAWDESAKMLKFDKETIKRDLIWASQAGNFIRICANWFEIEEKQGVYDYSTLDYVFDVIENDPEIGKIFVLLEIGPIKTSKVWVQASLPEWFSYRIDLQDPAFIESLKPFINKTVERYKDRPSLFAYQLENEPDFMTSTITDNDEDYIITGDVYWYLTWLNDYVKSIDPDHFTSINLFVNNLYTQKMLPPVDIILYDYYGSIDNTLPLTTYSRMHSQYIKGNIGFGVAELQLNNWHYQITLERLQEEYNACIESGMTLILWSELHDPYWWDDSAISYDNQRTTKYYKVQELYEVFKTQEIDGLKTQIIYDWLNVLIFSIGIFGFVGLLLILARFLIFNKQEVKFRIPFANYLFACYVIPLFLFLSTYISNRLYFGLGISLITILFMPFMLNKTILKLNLEIKYKWIKILMMVLISIIPLAGMSYLFYY